MNLVGITEMEQAMTENQTTALAALRAASDDRGWTDGWATTEDVQANWGNDPPSVRSVAATLRSLNKRGVVDRIADATFATTHWRAKA